MHHAKLSRRTALLGAAASLGGCSAVSALNSASRPLDTYDLSPAAGAKAGRRSTRTLLVARPDAPAAIATDRIMIRPDAASVTYLPAARWSDDLPLVVQGLLVRSIAATGRIAYVGPSEGGPVPDRALLVRLDAFEAVVPRGGAPSVTVAVALTVLNDRDQTVVATRSFAVIAPATNDGPTAIVAAFQGVLDRLLPDMADWVLMHV